MQIRGRRLALVLASALPLFADDASICPAVQSSFQWNQVAAAAFNGTNETYCTVSTASSAEGSSTSGGPPLPICNGIPLFTSENAGAHGVCLSSDLTDNLQRHDEECRSPCEDPNPQQPPLEESPFGLPSPSIQLGNIDSHKGVGGTNASTMVDANLTTTDGAESTSLELDSDENATQDDEDSIQKKTTAEKEEDDEDSISDRVLVDYASKSAGALIIEKSSSFKGTSNLLNNDKDKYAIAPCEDKKFVVVTLSEDILVKQIKLANFERFSSSVAEFQILGSQTLGKWFELGTYQAAPGNGEQTFDLLEPGWARYLKFKFLTHHGVEYYCTYSQIKVHGSTMVEGFHEQWDETDPESDVASSVDDNVVDQTESSTVERESMPQEVHLEGSEKMEANVVGGSSAANNRVPDDTTTHLEGSEGVSDHEPAAPGDAKDSLDIHEPAVSSDIDVRAFTASAELHQLLTRPDSATSTSRSQFHLCPVTRFSTGAVVENGGKEWMPRANEQLRLQHVSTFAHRSSCDEDDFVVATTKDYSLPELTDHKGFLSAKLLRLSPRSVAACLREPRETLDNIGKEAKAKQGMEHGKVETEHRSQEQPVGQEQQPEGDCGLPNSGSTKSIDRSGTQRNDTSTTAPDVQQHQQQEEQNDKREEDLDSSQTPTQPSIDPTLSKLLQELPSASCLSTLDFAEFKAKAAKKTASGSATAQSAGSNPMEPIFKKLTDEIKALQTSLTVHDQFTKGSVACYQRVLFDLVVVVQQLRDDQGRRLQLLEEQVRDSQVPLLHLITRSIARNASFAYDSTASFVSSFWRWLQPRAGLVVVMLTTSIRLAHLRALQAWPKVKAMLQALDVWAPFECCPLAHTSDRDHLLAELYHWKFHGLRFGEETTHGVGALTQHMKRRLELQYTGINGDWPFPMVLVAFVVVVSLMTLWLLQRKGPRTEHGQQQTHGETNHKAIEDGSTNALREAPSQDSKVATAHHDTSEVPPLL